MGSTQFPAGQPGHRDKVKVVEVYVGEIEYGPDVTATQAEFGIYGPDLHGRSTTVWFNEPGKQRLLESRTVLPADEYVPQVGDRVLVPATITAIAGSGVYGAAVDDGGGAVAVTAKECILIGRTPPKPPEHWETGDVVRNGDPEHPGDPDLWRYDERTNPRWQLLGTDDFYERAELPDTLELLVRHGKPVSKDDR